MFNTKLLKDIIEDGQGMINNYGKMQIQDKKSNCIDANYHKGMDNHGQRTVVANIYPSGGQNGNVYSEEGKAPALIAGTGLTGRGIGSCNAPKIATRQSEKAEARRVSNRKSLEEKGNCLQATSWKGECANGTTIVPVASKIESHNSTNGLKCIGGLSKNKKWLWTNKTS